MVDCAVDTPTKAKAKPDRRSARGRGRAPAAKAHRPRPEVYVLPEGMVDLALRELDARLVLDETDTPESRSAA